MSDTLHVVSLLIGCLVRGSQSVNGSVRAPDGHDIRLAQARGRFGESVEHPLQIEGGAAYHLEDFGGCRLLLEGLAQLLGPRLQLAE